MQWEKRSLGARPRATCVYVIEWNLFFGIRPFSACCALTASSTRKLRAGYAYGRYAFAHANVTEGDVDRFSSEFFGLNLKFDSGDGSCSFVRVQPSADFASVEIVHLAAGRQFECSSSSYQNFLPVRRAARCTLLSNS